MSYGNDMDIFNNPFECGFDKYVDLKSDIVFLGKESLKKIKRKGIKKKLMGVKIDGNNLLMCQKALPITDLKNECNRSIKISCLFTKI